MIEIPPPSSPSSPDADSSQDYWRRMSGHAYRQLIEGREGSGQEGYRRQEEVISGLVTGEQRRRGHELALLEFGCGFGRHASYLASLEKVAYHGYDFSEEMVTPLRQQPPQGMLPLGDHLFVGPDAGASLGERLFDFILTVSVLIHNPPQRIRPLLEDMARLLRPGGCICLVENKLVPFTVYENNWHQGCWLHRYLDSIGEGWDVHVGHDLISTHDVYLLRPNEQPRRRLFLLGDLTYGDHEPQPTSEATLDQLGIAKARAWAASVEGSLRDQPAQDLKTIEAEELLRAERDQLKRRQNLLSLAQELAAIRAARPEERRATSIAPQAASAVSIEFDAASDSHWAHQDPRFSRVVHVMHQEWHGIRAAAGYLPGHKLAIPANRSIRPGEVKEAIDRCGAVMARTVVLHGWSNNADELLHLMRRTLGPSTRIFAIWLGTTAQFHHDIEQDGLARLIDLRRRGFLEGLGAVKPDLHVLSSAIDREVILSLPPRLSETPAETPRGFGGKAVIPMPVDWRKNFYTTLFATSAVAEVRTIFVTADFKRHPEFEGSKKAVHLPFLDRWKLFRLLGEVDVALNTSLSECQPMVALEALAFGVPCLTGQLGLGDLDRHPYQQKVQVARVDSLGAVRDALQQVVDLLQRSPAELTGELNDYRTAYCARGLQRLGEFLRL
jgi:SAM-dependent methyltransferase